MLVRICGTLGLAASPSGIRRAAAFPSRWIMATVRDHQRVHERWKYSRAAPRISAIAATRAFAAVRQQLGLRLPDMPETEQAVGL